MTALEEGGVATFTMSRRTGALLAGVVPPGGFPLPQQTLGIGAWIGSPGELADPALRAELLRITQMRRELRTGHLLNAARIALDADLSALPPDAGTTRSVAVLRSVGAAHTESTSQRPEDVLKSSLVLLGPAIPPTLLDRLLSPDSRLPPKSVEAVCLDHDRSPATVTRLRVLLVRRAAQEYCAHPDQPRLQETQKRVREAMATPMHKRLHCWAEAVGNAAGEKDLTPLIEALGHNLPLTDPRNDELHQRLFQCCFDGPHLDHDTRRRLARLSFSAWSTLRDATDGTGAAELVSFSAQAAAFRQVFEVLLERAVLRRFLRANASRVRHGLLDAVSQGRATLGIGRWFELLFASGRRPDDLSEVMRRWFLLDEHVESLREGQRLRTALRDLLQVRLHALPHDEESARATASDVLDTVVRVGFGASSALMVPREGDGLVGQLVRVAL